MDIHRLPDGDVIRNDEIRMTNDEGSLNVQMTKAWQGCPHTGRQAVRMQVLIFSFLVILLLPVCGAANGVRPIDLGGYKAVPVRYGPLNKMIVSVQINGHPATLIVDTGANQLMLESSAARSFGVKPSPFGPRRMRLIRINRQEFPLGLVVSLTAGSMNLGSMRAALVAPSALRGSSSNRRDLPIDGILSSDVLLRHKAVINCRKKIIFFKVDPSRQLRLASVALSEKFTRVPLRQERNGAFTVPFSIRGRLGRLLVDTGTSVTTFEEAVVRSLGIALEPTSAAARFIAGMGRQISVGQIDDLMIGDFPVAPAKFGASALPSFVLVQGNTRIDGIVGMELLYKYRAIIDFDGMNLFLK